MKLRKLFLWVFICNSLTMFAQINEYFDGESLSEVWQGDISRFVIRDNGLQTKAQNEAGISYLSFASKAITDAEWKLSLQMDFDVSTSSYVRFFLSSDNPVLTDDLNGYYLQLGGVTSYTDQIVLYRKQEGKNLVRLGYSAKRLEGTSAVQIEVKVTRDSEGNWTVWSKKPEEADFIQDFSCMDATFESSRYAGVVCTYNKANSGKFFFNSLSVSGDAYIDATAPTLLSFSNSKDSLLLRFSEPIDAEQTVFHFSEQLSFQTEWNTKQTELIFRLNSPLESGKKYELNLESVPDLAGNILSDSTIRFAVIEPALPKDIIVNEVLFDASTGGAEYIELYNRSNKAIDLSQLVLYKRSAGALSSSRPLSSTEILILPGEYIVLTPDKEKVCSFYTCPGDEAFLNVAFTSLNNDSGYVVITDKNKDVIDEFHYFAKMHNPLIKTKRGVSLERQSPESDEWISASEDSGFGTPGYKNSQGFDTSVTETSVQLENEVCFPYQDENGHLAIRYHFAKGGYTADIYIFNVAGQRIRKLGENLSLSVEGTIYWDGKDDSGRIVPISPYILLFEAFHPNGDIFRKSLVGVVSK